MTPSYEIDQQRWARLSIFEQLGNIYSEVGRSFNARQRHNNADCQAAISRAIDLFDATAAALMKSYPFRAKEVLRAKEVYLGTVYDANAAKETIESLNRYFMQFAIASRLHR